MATKVTTKQKLEDLAQLMRDWQRLETQAVAQTARIMAATEIPLVRQVMQIIQRDSTGHYQVQGFIVDSLEKQQINVPADELIKIWDAIEEHIRIEKRTVEFARKGLESIQGTRNVVQQYLLSYLLADELKHEKLLADLDLIKRKMYP